MIKIDSNQQCISLNQEPYLASSPEDQIAVSFVCDTRLLVLRLCMRPHFLTDMSRLKQQPAYRPDSDGTLDPTVLQFGQAYADPVHVNISLMY